MDFDIGNLLYIAFALLYFVFTARKKAQKKKTATPSSSPDRRGDTVGPIPANQPSFDELFEQFTGKKSLKEKPTTSTYQKSYEQIGEDKNLEAIQEESPLAQKRKSIYDKTSQRIGAKKIADIQIFNQSNIDREQELKNENSDYAAMIGNVDGARKAFVMSEIFNRKY